MFPTRIRAINMKKYFVFALLLLASCNQGGNSTTDTDNITTVESDVEAVVLSDSENHDKSNSSTDNAEFAQVVENLPRLTKDSPDYISSVNEMKSLEKQRERLLGKINQKYSQYLGYNLVYCDYAVLQSSHNLVRAVMREERLMSY